MIRMLDHTADVGFEVAEVPTLEDLFDEARQALLRTVFFLRKGNRPPA